MSADASQSPRAPLDRAVIDSGGAGTCHHPGRTGLGVHLQVLLVAVAATVGLSAYYMMGASSLVLTEPDEARCALVARHMVTSGDWMAPQLLGRPYFDKPPLYFWMLAASVTTFGESEWALRLPSAVIGAATVVLTGLLAWQLFGRAAGVIAAVAFGVSIAGLMAARVVRMDMLLTLWVTASLVCWIRGYLPFSSAEGIYSPVARPEARDPKSACWYAAMYICMAFGCLTKGPVAILLPALVIGVYMLLSRPVRDLPREIWHLRPLSGVAIIAVIYGSWVGYMTWRYPEYPREFFWRQNVDRFGGSGLDAAAAWWVIPGAFVGGLMPWAAIAALASWDRRPRYGIPPAEKVLWIWGLAVLAFFTLSKARLPNYVLPAFPSTFALIGGYLAAAGERHRTRLLIAAITTIAIGVAGVIGWAIASQQRFGHGDYLQAAARAGVLLLLIAPTWLLWKRRPALVLLPFFIGYVAITVEFAYGPARQYFASRCTKDLAGPLASLDPATAGEIVMTTEPRYGAVFYAPPGWRFRLVGTTQLGQLLPELKTSDRPRYAILTGGGLLRALQQDQIRDLRVSDRLTVLQRCDYDALVRIAPRPADESRPGAPRVPAAEISQPLQRDHKSP